jgi:hypothetical protein
VSEAKQGRAWLVLGWRQILRRNCSETSSLETRGECHQSSNGVTRARPLKITNAKRIEEVVLIHVWIAGIKALPDTNSYFLDRIFYLETKMTISTGSKYVL